jgi:UMF1 family MFS transporter
MTRPTAPSSIPDAAKRRAVWAWCMYDWANSAFATSVIAAILPQFFAAIAKRSLPANVATAYWGYASAAALLIAALLGPILGSAADQLGQRKRFLFACVAVGCVTTGLLAVAPFTGWRALLGLFGVAFVAFAMGNVLYDSLLPSVAPAGEIHRVSARGFAYGYVGGGVLLALNLFWILKPALFHLPSVDFATRLSFLSVALWWFGFSLPLFRHVPEPEQTRERVVASQLARAVFRGLWGTLRSIRRQPELMRFLIAFWLYSDGIGTVIKMATIYGSEVGIGMGDLIGALLMVQILAAPASIVFGRMAGAFDPRTAVIIGLAGYVGITALGYYMSAAWHFWVLAGLVALFQGGTQALSRSMFARLAPRSQQGELFGFYSVSEKLAGVVGPIAFGAVAQVSGTGRLAVLTLLPFFVAGAWLLRGVDLDQGAARAGN